VHLHSSSQYGLGGMATLAVLTQYQEYILLTICIAISVYVCICGGGAYSSIYYVHKETYQGRI
jgi:hypothetical protein